MLLLEKENGKEIATN